MEFPLIKSLHLNFGGGSDLPPLDLPLGPSMTIVVGPNNSGKSLLLREISQYVSTGSNSAKKILKSIRFAETDQASAQHELSKMRHEPPEAANTPKGHVLISGTNGYVNIPEAEYIQGRLSPDSNPSFYAIYFAKHLSRHLDGTARLGLLASHPLGNLHQPEGLLSRILTNDEKRALIRRRIHDQLGLYFALDITQTPAVSVRLGSSPPPNERSFEEATIEYMKRAPRLDDFSDGVRAFCGLMAHIHSDNIRVMTVDEPEAFLSPPLAHALGKELAEGARNESKQIFVSTHSSHFLTGAISSGAKVNIIRLTYDPGIGGTARLLEWSKLVSLMNDPMLRSANVLSALFYRGAVVSESDADRAFYQECNERLIDAKDARAARDIVFLNANGKDVIPMIVEPLRRLGVPTASITDLDVVKVGGESWIRHLKSIGIPTPDHEPYGLRRQKTCDALHAADGDWKRKGGLAVLTGENLASSTAFIDDLARYGMFVVRHGEVESWLASLNISRGKHSWLRSIFKAMGNDPEALGYVKPASGDVWQFIGFIAEWLRARERRGL